MGYDAHLNLHKMEENKTLIYPAIVVATYNRPNALQRLLGSIARADYTGYENIPLVISIDGGGNPECRHIAETFAWNYGAKRIIAHDSNMGLKKHILSCGDLTEQYGAVIMLEEDVYVSPYFYDYSVQTTSYYQFESKVAGVSLFFLKNNELTGTPFIPLQNGYDVFFAQVPSSWGQTWTDKQWQGFREWLKENDNKPVSISLPLDVQIVWPNKSSWKKFFFSYMVENDLYFIMPYVSYATNMGDAGEHCKEPTMMFQTNLMEFASQMKLCPFGKDGIVYDAYFELLPSSFKSFGVLREYDVTIDLSGTKVLSEIKTPYLLSIKHCRKPIATYGMCFSPVEINVIENNESGKIFLGKVQDFDIKRDKEAYNKLLRINNEMVYLQSFQQGHKVGFQEGYAYVRTTKYYRLGAMLLKPINLIMRFFSKR